MVSCNIWGSLLAGDVRIETSMIDILFGVEWHPIVCCYPYLFLAGRPGRSYHVRSVLPTSARQDREGGTMPYTAEINRVNPTCFLFLVDQSSSMSQPFGAQPGKQKAEGVADAINRLLQNLVLKCAKSDGIRDYFHLGIIGYGTQAGSVLAGPVAGQALVAVSAIANSPLRVEPRTRKVDDGAGGFIEQQIKF